ncbi:MAG: hypothetical protein K0Q73_2144 [Paenibacillus sp.]|jgi:hypothetical protein|nr:hypothetical protein [Paenibacillus sp.]
MAEIIGVTTWILATCFITLLIIIDSCHCLTWPLTNERTCMYRRGAYCIRLYGINLSWKIS